MKGFLTLLAVSLLFLFNGCSDSGNDIVGPELTDSEQISQSQATAKTVTDAVLTDGDVEGDPWEDHRLGGDGEPGPPAEDPGFRRGGHAGELRVHGPYSDQEP